MMKRYPILVLISFVLTGPILAQDVPPPPPPPPPPPLTLWEQGEKYGLEATVSIVADWDIGEKFRYKVMHSMGELNNRQLTRIDTMEYHAEWEVVGKGRKSYTIRWRFEDDAIGLMAVPYYLIPYFPKVKFGDLFIDTDEWGAYEGIRNWEAVAEVVRQGFSEALINVSREQEIPIDTLRAYYGPMIEGYTSKDGIEYTILKEISLLHSSFGYSFEVYDKYEYKKERSNPLGEGTIAGKGEVYFEEYDSTEGFCSIIHNHTFVPEVDRDTRKDILLNVFSPGRAAALADDLLIVYRDIYTDNFMYYWGYPLFVQHLSTAENILESINYSQVYFRRTAIVWDPLPKQLRGQLKNRFEPTANGEGKVPDKMPPSLSFPLPIEGKPFWKN